MMIVSAAKNGLLCGLAILLAFTMGCTKDEEKGRYDRTASSGKLNKPILLATIGVDATVAASGKHGSSVTGSGFVFGQKGGGAAYIESKAGRLRVRHNNRFGKWYHHIEGLTISPDGSSTAYVAQIGEKYCVVRDGKEGQTFDNVGFPRFSPDGQHIVYNATHRGKGRLVVDDLMSPPFPSSWDEQFTGDSSKVISIQNADDQSTKHAVVTYDLNLRKLWMKEVDAVGFIYNKDRTRLAVIGLESGKQRLILLSIDDPDNMRMGPLYNEIVHIAFAPDDASVAYFAATVENRRLVVLNEREALLPEGLPTGPPVVRSDNKVVGVTLKAKNGGLYHEAFGDRRHAEKRYDGAGQPFFSRDGKRSGYVARVGKDVFTVVDGNEGPKYDIIIAPEYSRDGKYLVYRARKDGIRFIVIANAVGELVRQHPGYEQVFPARFSDDGKTIAYGIKDGNRLLWSEETL